MHSNRRSIEHCYKPFAIAGCASIVFAGCGGANVASFPAAPGNAITHRALVVGAVPSAIYSALAQQYRADAGTGAEDPAPYDLIVFDGSAAAPGAVKAKPGPANFLRLGKVVVLLNIADAQHWVAQLQTVYATARGGTSRGFVSCEKLFVCLSLRCYCPQ